MTRKVVVNYQGLEHRVDGDDIKVIIKDSQLDDPLNSEHQRLAALGLMYLERVSYTGGGTGDITGWDRFLTDSQKQLFEPAFRVIDNYYAKGMGILVTEKSD